jgi:RNA polymerase sigma-70 factor, ECF subfamily
VEVSAPTRFAPDDSGEAALLAGLRGGDPDAYERLVRGHAGRLLAAIRRILRNEEDAQEALQDAFLSAFKGLPGFDGAARLSTWLHRVAVNAALMKLRGRLRKPEQSLEPLLPGFLEDGHQSDPAELWGETADRALERKEMRELVRACIDQLPETYRTVLVLRDIEELDTEEAARLLGVTCNAVKVRLHRARQALRTLLDPHFRGGTA